ncbi:MAG: sulfatase [Saprospiraceae bacterium]|nr:sulfatase [Saprospiraceae bacterium]
MKSLNLLLLLALLTAASCSTPTQESTRPNILLIFTDDHSYQTFSAYDDRFIETPNLDRIADEGVLFENSFVTNSICAPSRAVILTGKHSHINGQTTNGVTFDSTQNSFIKELGAAGYETALIGKWHLRSRPTGFDHYEVLIGQGHYYNTDFIENGVKVQRPGYVTDVVTDKSLDWLEERTSDKPFCLMVQHKATHRIWQPDTSLFHEFEGVEFPLPANFFDDYEGRPAAAMHRMGIDEHMDLVWDNKMLDDEGEIETFHRDRYERVMYNRMNDGEKAAWDAYYDPIIADFKASKLEGKALAEWKYQRYMHDYLKCVRSVDNNVGRILAYLDENGLAENTLVVYTSDQGFYMGEHGWFDKRYMYEESLRTPLVMRFPAAYNARGKVEELVQNLDLAPTFLDIADVAIPQDMQGRSLLPIVEREEQHWRDAIYYHYYEYPNEHGTPKHYGIRSDRYKLIHFYEGIDSWEFYDLQQDPSEMHNAYEDDAYQDIIEEHKGRLAQLRKQYMVPEDPSS